MRITRFAKACILLFTLVHVAIISSAQEFDSILVKVGQTYPQEKIYLHFDKPFYNPGETIWFKAYVLMEDLSAGLSKTLYAELIGEDGEILQKKTMPINQSGAASFFELPEQAAGSNVVVRAYTAWMLNFDSTLLYYKKVPISSSGKLTETSKRVFSFGLFPEGGQLVEGLESIVAFKATDGNGEPIAVTGSIVNSKREKILDFTSIHDGMGSFRLTPGKGENYEAIWKDPAGLEHITRLPAASSRGLSLSLTRSGNQVFYKVERPANPDNLFETVSIVAQMHHQLVYSAKLNMNQKAIIKSGINVEAIPSGVLVVTAFNSQGSPVAERIIFINNENYSFSTDLNAPELNLAARGHNTLQIDANTEIAGNLSIAVTDAGLTTVTGGQDNIYSSFLLSSDLRGYIHNPAYYFSSEEDSVARHLDLVMLTNGWRRFNWEQLLAGKFPVLTRRPENFISIHGKLLGLPASTIKGREISSILRTSAGEQIILMPLDAEGNFSVQGLNFADSARMYFQLNGDKGRALSSKGTFSASTVFASAPKPLPAYLAGLIPARIPEPLAQKNLAVATETRELQEDQKVKMLSAVTLKSKVKTPAEKLNDEFTHGFFRTDNAMVFDVLNNPNARTSMSVLEYLRSRVAGLNINTIEGVAMWRGSKTTMYLNEAPSDIESMQMISMNEVALIKVFRPLFFGAPGGGEGGAIAVYLRREVDEKDLLKGIDYAKIRGYSAIKEFYSPDYDRKGDAAVKDLRTTLYWNPNLTFDKKTKRLKIPFFNSDNCRKLRVIIEGLNEQGELTRVEKVFE